jgi:hypothetical protein
MGTKGITNGALHTDVAVPSVKKKKKKERKKKKKKKKKHSLFFY